MRVTQGDASLTGHGWMTHPDGRPAMTSLSAGTRRRRSTMGSPFAQPMRALEENTRLDALIPQADKAAARVTANPTIRDILQGRWLGHALHPVLVEVPIGTWASAALLDVFGSRRDADAARFLTGVGLLAVLPTAMSGWAEYAETTRSAEKRVGVVHAGVNVAAVLLQLGSWLARRRGDVGRGRSLGLAATSLVGLGGYLGGHLASARNVGTSDPAFDGAT